jgi:hypothetical protein
VKKVVKHQHILGELFYGNDIIFQVAFLNSFFLTVSYPSLDKNMH